MEVTIEGIDKNGVFIGRILLPAPETEGADAGGSAWAGGAATRKRVPYSLLLVSAGLARIDKYAVEQGTDTESLRLLQEAQEVAKTARLGVWSMESAIEEDDADLMEDLEADMADALAVGDDASPSTRARAAPARAKWALGELVDVQLSEITNGVTFYANEVASLPKLEQITQELAALAATRRPGVTSAAVGAQLAVHFEDAPAEEGAAPTSYWCRVRVLEVAGDLATVSYVDYGNK